VTSIGEGKTPDELYETLLKELTPPHDVLQIAVANADDIERLHSWFDAISGRLPPILQHGMRVALEEVVLNAVMHGFAPQASGEIMVGLQITLGSAVLSVEDTGHAFDPTMPRCRSQPVDLLEAEPGGVGLGLLHHYCHDLTYERVDDRNRLTTRFALPPN
jgi:serine/threonine-protein kinase RsbW